MEMTIHACVIKGVTLNKSSLLLDINSQNTQTKWLIKMETICESN